MSSPDQEIQSPGLMSDTESSSSVALPAQATSDNLAPTNDTVAERNRHAGPVFGIPLAEAVQRCVPPECHMQLPAVDDDKLVSVSLLL
ncbi:hypothetical protein N7527_005536 [Penicillium freii]|nr:hypothetical protein N7527_005536 [Penicillium freii]